MRNVVAMKIRDVIIGCFMVGWIAVTIIVAFKTGSVPAELWTVPGAGLGALMALFRKDEDDEDEDEKPAPVTNQEPQGELPS